MGGRSRRVVVVIVRMRIKIAKISFLGVKGITNNMKEIYRSYLEKLSKKLVLIEIRNQIKNDLFIPYLLY
jgi:hypothetical protein